MGDKALQPGEHRLFMRGDSGPIEEAIVVGKDLSPGWYLVTAADGSQIRAQRDTLYANTPEARGFLNGLAAIAAIEREISEAAAKARTAARAAREADLNAVREQVEVLRRTGKLH